MNCLRKNIMGCQIHIGWIRGLLIPFLTFFGFTWAKEIKIDGSSTVYPLTEAIAEEYQKRHKDVKITIGISGTGGGFKKFLRGEIDINNASREISESEKKIADEKKIKYIEIPVAYDGIAVVVHKKNNWINEITIENLRKIWSPEAEGKITNWRHINKTFPNLKLLLFGAGVDSGTFDFFTEVVCGKAKSSRADYTASEDDNVLVYGVSTNKNSLGYFGYAYYLNNKDKLKALSIRTDKGAFLPTKETISNGTYPLSRPLLIYVNENSMKNRDIFNFVIFYLENVERIVEDVGYIPLPKHKYESTKEKIIKKFQ